MKRLLLFDIDGTLIDTGGAGRSALHSAMLDVYGDVGAFDAFSFHGKTDPAIVRALLRDAGRSDAAVDEGLAELWTRYFDYLDEELERRATTLSVYPGVLRLLTELGRSTEVGLGLVTGNVEGGAWRKLRACGLSGHFALGAFGSDSEAREQLPPIAIERARSRLGVSFAPADVVLIGDTPEDIRAARCTGVGVLAVASGRFSRSELSEHLPDHLFDNLTETAIVMRALLE